MLLSILGAFAVAIVLAIPTSIVANPWFTRMTPVESAQYVWWIGVSAVSGMLLATYAWGWTGGPAGRAGLGGGALGYLAVGCPICNKVVVAMLGTSGALTYFAPIQPLLGLIAVALTMTALIQRMHAAGTGCPVPGSAASLSS